MFNEIFHILIKIHIIINGLSIQLTVEPSVTICDVDLNYRNNISSFFIYYWCHINHTVLLILMEHLRSMIDNRQSRAKHAILSIVILECNLQQVFLNVTSKNCTTIYSNRWSRTATTTTEVIKYILVNIGKSSM